ncbi:unnamed protein product [Diabrotica balteata]|uniref:Uncharacterized protein n=1 Tax=Diabrotica balteata TaxID=107213 RepID=A0A9N9XC08_DIABA|nr:unnamed protein product [Diabrotica balteata]
MGTELESYIIPSEGKAKANIIKASTKAPPKKDWRRTYEEFIAAIRAAKKAQAHLSKGGKLSDLPPPPPSTNLDYVQCPHCNRRFNEDAAENKIWHTDLDFIVTHKDRVVLNFKTSNTTFVHTTPMMQKALSLPTTAATKPSAMPFVSAPVVTNTVIKTLKDIIGHENHTMLDNKEIETSFISSVNIEYMNLALALVIYSIRYPALFWATNKCLGLIFSFQLLINGLHILLSFAGMSILYKVHVVGVWKALPLLKHNAKVYSFGSPTPFLLNSQVTFALYTLSTLLVLASSIVLYFYGHTR